MRVSADRNDVGYNPERLSKVRAVFLNSEPVPQCLTADEEEGLVIVHKTDSRGQLIIEGDSLATEIKLGKVKIVFEP